MVDEQCCACVVARLRCCTRGPLDAVHDLACGGIVVRSWRASMCVSVVLQFEFGHDVHGLQLLKEQFASVRHAQDRHLLHYFTVLTPVVEPYTHAHIHIQHEYTHANTNEQPIMCANAYR